MKSWSICLTILSLILLGVVGCQSGENKSSSSNTNAEAVDKVLNLYTFRYEEKDRQLLEAFQNLNRIQVNVTHLSSQEQLDKLLSGDNVGADLLLMDDMGILQKAKEQGKLQPFSSTIVDNNIADKYRDMDGYWIGVSKSAISFAFPKGSPEFKNTRKYADLAKKTWNGKVAATRLNSRTNRALLAGLIQAEGQQKTEGWANNLVKNLVEEPLISEDSLIRMIAAKKAEVGIIDSGAFLRFKYSGNPEDFATADQVDLVYPTTTEGNTITNINFFAMSSQVVNRKEAIKFVEFVTGPNGQKNLSEMVLEFSLNPIVIPSDIVIQMGGYKESPLNLQYLSNQDQLAQTVGEKAAWK